MVKKCERCGALPPRIERGPWAGQRHLHNFCVHCSRDLCEECLSKGRCSQSPTRAHEVEKEDA